MDAKQAIALAKAETRTMFSSDGAHDVRLEEIEFDDVKGQWNVTVSFSWPTPSSKRILEMQDLLSSFARHRILSNRAIVQELTRAYKAILIDDITGKVRSIKDRDILAA